MKCIACEFEIKRDAKFCSQCGAQQLIECQECHEKTSANLYTCSHCGANFRNSAVSKLPNNKFESLIESPAHLQKSIVQIKECLIQGPLKDKTYKLVGKFSYQNLTKQTLKQPIAFLQIFNSKGIHIESVNETIYETFKPNKTSDFDININDIQKEIIEEKLENLVAIINVAGVIQKTINYGKAQLPSKAFEYLPLRSITIESSLNILSASLWITHPDKDGDIQVFIKMFLQSISNTPHPTISCNAVIIGEDGQEIAEFSDYADCLPNSFIILAPSTYIKADLINDAFVEISLSYPEVISRAGDFKIGFTASNEIEEEDTEEDEEEDTDEENTSDNDEDDEATDANSDDLSSLIWFGDAEEETQIYGYEIGVYKLNERQCELYNIKFPYLYGEKDLFLKQLGTDIEEGSEWYEDDEIEQGKVPGINQIQSLCEWSATGPHYGTNDYTIAIKSEDDDITHLDKDELLEKIDIDDEFNFEENQAYIVWRKGKKHSSIKANVPNHADINDIKIQTASVPGICSIVTGIVYNDEELNNGEWSCECSDSISGDDWYLVIGGYHPKVFQLNFDSNGAETINSENLEINEYETDYNDSVTYQLDPDYLKDLAKLKISDDQIAEKASKDKKRWKFWG